MTDLHLDVMSMDWHIERNQWNIKLAIFIGGEIKEPLDTEDIHNGYDHIFIPMTLSRCLVIVDGGITQIKFPTYSLGNDHIRYQDIWVSGREFYIMSMETYLAERMKEKLGAE